MKHRAVIFDLWQTLVPWDIEESTKFNTEVAETIGVEPERYLEAWLTAHHLPSRNTGPASDHFRALFDELGVEADLDRVLAMRRARARRVLVPRPDALPTLDELRRRGHLLGMISVCTQDVPDVWDETPLGGKFDVTVFSCDVGLSKPDPRIYRIACEQLEVDPGDCLFVGDGANDGYQAQSAQEWLRFSSEHLERRSRRTARPGAAPRSSTCTKCSTSSSSLDTAQERQ